MHALNRSNFLLHFRRAHRFLSYHLIYYERERESPQHKGKKSYSLPQQNLSFSLTKHSFPKKKFIQDLFCHVFYHLNFSLYIHGIKSLNRNIIYIKDTSKISLSSNRIGDKLNLADFWHKNCVFCAAWQNPKLQSKTKFWSARPRKPQRSEREV